jgi:hypothetical protein
VLVIDTGISGYYGGHMGSLLIENDRLTNIQRGEAITIPTSNDELSGYYESVLLLEPESSNLKILVDRLKNTSPSLSPAPTSRANDTIN